LFLDIFKYLENNIKIKTDKMMITLFNISMVAQRGQHMKEELEVTLSL